MKKLLIGFILLNSVCSHADTYIRHQMKCSITGTVESLNSPLKKLPKRLEFELNIVELAQKEWFYEHKVVSSELTTIASVEALSKKECKERKRNNEGECSGPNENGDRLFVSDLGINPLVINKVYSKKEFDLGNNIGWQRTYFNRFNLSIKEMNNQESETLLKMMGEENVSNLPYGFSSEGFVSANGPVTYRIIDELNVKDGKSYEIKFDCSQQDRQNVHEFGTRSISTARIIF